MSSKQEWISHENYVLEDALSLMNCFLLENSSWLDNLYLTAICSLATMSAGKPIRPETQGWLHRRLAEASKKTTRELLKDKYLVLGIFLGTKVVLKKSPDFLREIKLFLEKLIDSLEKVDWNNDPYFPAVVLFSLAGSNFNLNEAKRYLLTNMEFLWKQGRRRSVIYSLLGLLKFREGRIAIARLLKNIGIFETPERSLSKLDLESIAILLLTVSEIETKHRYILYEALEQNLRNEFLEVRSKVLSVLFHQLDKAVIREKLIIAAKDDAVNSLRYHSHNSGTVSVEVPFEAARKLFERPHLSDIALSIMAIKSASLEILYSLDEKTFERKCRPALRPSEYVAVKRSHLLYFLIYTILGVIAVTALSQVLSNNPLITFLAAVLLLLFSIGFAKDYFSQLVSDLLKRKIGEEEG